MRSVTANLDPRCRCGRARLARAVITVALGGLLASCAAGVPGRAPLDVLPCPDGQRQAATTVTVTVTGTSAEPLPALPASVLDDLARLGRRDDGCVLLVGPDGQAQALSLTPRRSDGQLEQGSQRETLRVRTLAAVLARLAGLAATANGLDTRAALTRAVAAHPAPGTIVVVSSGISTVDPVSLPRLGWAADGATLGTFLRAQGWLDLTGWDVRFVGLGVASGSQPALSDPAQRRVVQLWTEICRATGALRCFPSGAAAAQPAISHDTVPVVAPPADPLYVENTFLPARALFGLDSAALTPSADPALAALVTRATVADQVISVVGHADASTGSTAHNLELSRERADAVRDRLLALGLAPDRIVSVTGLGASGYSAAQERRQPALVTLHRTVEIRFATRPVLP